VQFRQKISVLPTDFRSDKKVQGHRRPIPDPTPIFADCRFGRQPRVLPTADFVGDPDFLSESKGVSSNITTTIFSISLMLTKFTAAQQRGSSTARGLGAKNYHFLRILIQG
jgi:hypothetical protein